LLFALTHTVPTHVCKTKWWYHDDDDDDGHINSLLPSLSKFWPRLMSRNELKTFTLVKLQLAVKMESWYALQKFLLCYQIAHTGNYANSSFQLPQSHLFGSHSIEATLMSVFT